MRSSAKFASRNGICLKTSARIAALRLWKLTNRRRFSEFNDAYASRSVIFVVTRSVEALIFREMSFAVSQSASGLGSIRPQTPAKDGLDSKGSTRLASQ